MTAFEDTDKAVLREIWATTFAKRELPPCCLAAIERDDLTGHASCTFGCGSRIDDDTRMCPTCKDHSANSMECEQGHTLEKWGDTWERQ